MALFNTLKFLWNHPLSQGREWKVLGRFVGWQLSNLFLRPTIIFEMIPGVKMYLRKGMYGASGNYYCGLHEYEEMKFLLHHLQPDHLFVDVGANVGSYSMLAAAGCNAKVIAIEPVEKTAAWLKKNITLNKVEHLITIHEKVIGGSNKDVHMITHLDTMNYVVAQHTLQSVHYEQTTLDEVLQEENPMMIKIDVEGYDLDVLKGMKKVLLNPSLQFLIIETEILDEFPSYTVKLLAKNGFEPFRWNAKEEKIMDWKHPQPGVQNILFRRV